MTDRRRGMAERLRWLFDVMRPGERDRVGGRRDVDPELVAHLAETLGEEQAVMRDAVARVCAGETVRADVLDGIAAFFHIPSAYFGDDPARVDAIRDTVLDRAMAASGARSWLLCRMAPPQSERRRQLRMALAALRPMSAEARSHDDDHSGERARHDGLGEPMDLGQLRTLCRDLVHELELSAPFEADELCERLGDRRNRLITVRAVDLGGTTGVGHLVRTEHADRILVDHGAPKAQRDVVIYHEIIHLVRDHLDGTETMSCVLGGDRQPSAPSSDRREWEAEVGARELAALARKRPLPNRLSSAAGPEERSISAAFGFAEAP